MTYGEWLDAPYEPSPVAAAVRIDYTGSKTSGTLALDVLDPADLRRRAELLHAEGIGHSVNDVIATLSRVPRGSRIVLKVEQPDEPETEVEPALLFTADMLAPIARR